MHGAANTKQMQERYTLASNRDNPLGNAHPPNLPPPPRSGHSTVEDFCNKIHKTMIKQFKFGLVWGASAKHRPQRVGKDHVLVDEDIVQVVKKI